MKVLHLWSCDLVSDSLKNIILSFFSNISLDVLDENTVDLVIDENYGNEKTGDLVIANFPKLKSITVNPNSLQNIRSLVIENNDKLSTIQFIESSESSRRLQGNSSIYFWLDSYIENSSLRYLLSLRIKSIFFSKNITRSSQSYII